ncbi:hypothetical protein D3C87_1578840 [compost metagenome]
MPGIAFGDVEANQSIALEPLHDRGIVEHLVFDDFATDAPVGVPVQQQRGAGGTGVREHAIELCRRADGLPGAAALRLFSVGDNTRLADRIERIGLATECAVPAGQRVKQQEHPE